MREVVRAEGTPCCLELTLGTNSLGQETPPVPPACPAGNCVMSPKEEDLLREIRLAGVIRCRLTRNAGGLDFCENRFQQG